MTDLEILTITGIGVIAAPLAVVLMAARRYAIDWRDGETAGGGLPAMRWSRRRYQGTHRQ